MKVSDFDYTLPKELIAQEPVSPRDHSRLLVMKRLTAPKALSDFQSDRALGAVLEDKYFYDLPDYLKEGDVLVLNNSKVFPARLIGKKKKTGGKIEIFLHQFIKGGVWNCLVGGRRVRIGLEVEFSGKTRCVITKDNKDGTWEVEFNRNYKELMTATEKIGQVPLPPYIVKSRKLKVESKKDDKKNYQTVYADNKKIGSVAAPTAGFHFTPELIKKLKAKGVRFEYITLHVGLGTFAPVKVDDITKHKMHAEYVEINKNVLERIIKAKKESKRIIAVGTTSARSLESFFINPKSYKLTANSYSSWVDIFIYPGYKFKIVDAMITNFHLPKSTLLMLVSAMAGKKNIDKAYKYAIKNKYRFYSYGDAMFIY
ncbi:tRNA preQ1(34) S-adenosylmethionine ribosyltransferase-isomerase QueA [Candidatus Falkowbacteria bacterium]|nr:MAG: tRNA preQ1(34) S-adenosylmethionine ribosyltransferase-isomerase QueA [Candidatus Falkowbacteria bacterium]